MNLANFIAGVANEADGDKSHQLIVCTACRTPDEAREPKSSRSGNRMFESLRSQYQRWSDAEGFRMEPYDCLSACLRPCVIALRAPGKFTYVFGDSAPGTSERDVIECATTYRRVVNGFLLRAERPLALRAAIISRVPPLL
jgi:predicted metal-binding protein